MPTPRWKILFCRAYEKTLASPLHLSLTVWGLMTSIDYLNSEAAPSFDGITMSIIESFPVIKLHLLFVLTACFKLHYLPNYCKTTKGALIDKPNKADYSVFNSFRPISLVNSLVQILVKIILSWLQWHAWHSQWSQPERFFGGKIHRVCRSCSCLIYRKAHSAKKL